MLEIDRNLLDIDAKRQRKEIPKGHVANLKESIFTRALLHAPVVQPKPDGRYLLVAGECRTRAIDLGHSEGLSFSYNQRVFPVGRMPVVLVSEAISELDRGELELDENTQRAELPWQDRVQALAFLHELRTRENPNQTVRDTAQEIIASGTTAAAGLSETSAAPETDRNIRQNITRATVIARHLDNPAIAKARNATEAFNAVVALEEKAFMAELIKRGTKKVVNCEVRHGDALQILPKMDSGLVDLILTDPPYGIDVDGAGFRSRTVHHHNYEDSPDVARQLISCILTEGFRICKPRANLFVFGDIDLFGWFKEAAARAGWDPFRTPITWQKSDSEGMAPWGREGFRRTTEWIFFARKGQKGLIHSPIDVLRYNRVGRADREYGPEKPVDLLKTLIGASCLPGEFVFDPCCGSGSTLVAARALNMRSLGIEKDLAAFNLALVNSQKDLQPEGLAAL